VEKTVTDDTYTEVVDALVDRLELMRSSGLDDLCGVRDYNRCRLVMVAEPRGAAARETLSKMVCAMGLSTGEVYVCGASGAELDSVLSRVPARMIVALGPAASLAALGDGDVASLRGRFHERDGGIRVRATWGIGQFAQRPGLKREAWKDLQVVMRELED